MHSSSSCIWQSTSSTLYLRGWLPGWLPGFGGSLDTLHPTAPLPYIVFPGAVVPEILCLDRIVARSRLLAAPDFFTMSLWLKSAPYPQSLL